MGERRAYPLEARGYRALHEVLTSAEFKERAPSAAINANLMMLFCGLRVGEATSCVSGWVETTDKGTVIRVPEAVSSDSFTPKTQAGSRTVPVPDDYTDHSTGEVVTCYLADRLEGYFMGNNEIVREKNSVRRWLAEACQMAGSDIDRREKTRVFGSEKITYPDVIPHDLRASWCAQCLRSGVNRYTIRDWGGWATMSMINRYAKYVGDPNGEQIGRF